MDHKKIIEESLSQLMDYANERDAIEHKMGKLHLAARAHLGLIDNKAEREALKAMLDNYRVRIGLTDLVLLCLNTFDKPLTPSEIKAFIVNFGSEASTQQNILQSVHTILKRLEGDRIRETVNEDGEKAYRLVTIAERLLERGIPKAVANKVGDRIESRFDTARAFTEILGINVSGEVPGIAKPFPARTRPPKKGIGQQIAEISEDLSDPPIAKFLRGDLGKK
jgi:hypothetical protein